MSAFIHPSIHLPYFLLLLGRRGVTTPISQLSWTKEAGLHPAGVCSSSRGHTHAHKHARQKKTFRTPGGNSELPMFNLLRSKNGRAANRRQREHQPPLCNNLLRSTKILPGVEAVDVFFLSAHVVESRDAQYLCARRVGSPKKMSF